MREHMRVVSHHPGRFVIPLLLVLCLMVGFGAQPAPVLAENQGFLTFETGSDNAPIDLPGVRFTIEDGEPWRYGDVRTRQYNAPYPSSCVDRPADIATPVCEYAVNGNFFAWLGTVGANGAMEFTGGTASYVELDVSAGAPVQLVAYSPTDRPISAIVMRPNAGTDRNRRVRLDAPTGEQIAYITFEGSASLWLIDDLATDAPGVPDQRIPETRKPALVTVVQRLPATTTLSPGGIFTLELVITNRGAGPASATVLTLSLPSARVRVLNATFSRADAWVSRLQTDLLEIRTGALRPNGDTVKATLQFAVADSVNVGDDLGGVLSFTWSDDGSGGRSRSNTLVLPVGAQLPIPFAGLTASPADGTNLSFTSTIFAPGEPVAFWYNTPDGKAVELRTLRADANGQIAVILNAAGLPPGTYTLVAFGHWTEFTAVAPFSR